MGSKPVEERAIEILEDYGVEEHYHLEGIIKALKSADLLKEDKPVCPKEKCKNWEYKFMQECEGCIRQGIKDMFEPRKE